MLLLRIIFLPFLVLWATLCLLVAIVTLTLGLLWGFIIPSQHKKVEAESTMEDSFDEDFDPSLPYEWLRKPRSELSTTQKYKRLRWQYGRQMFVPTSPKVRAAWMEAERRAATSQG